MVAELGGSCKADSLRLGERAGLLITRLEVRLALQAGVAPPQVRKYVGRGRSPTFQKVPLLASRPKARPWGEPALVAWSALAGRLQDLAAAGTGQEARCLRAVKQQRVEQVDGMEIDLN